MSFAVIALSTVTISWIAFAAVFLLRPRTSPSADRKKDASSRAGLILQGSAYAIVWFLMRPWFSPLVANQSLAAVANLMAVALSLGSVMLAAAALRTLGKEWSLTARVLEGHKLATKGPYRFVRHPIYTAMLGMLLATSFAFGNALGLLLALVAFGVGTGIRIHSEEKLLRETFGAEFDAYANRVSALVPGLY